MPTILVVDDEQVVRRWVVMTISTFGEYQILQAADPQAALEIAEHYPLNLLISDCVMRSKTSGAELGRRIAVSQTELKIILMSGYEDQTILHVDRGWRFLRKPFSPAALRAAIVDALADGRNTSDMKMRSRVRQTAGTPHK